jgi:hypothetical protein
MVFLASTMSRGNALSSLLVISALFKVKPNLIFALNAFSYVQTDRQKLLNAHQRKMMHTSSNCSGDRPFVSIYSSVLSTIEIDHTSI